MKVYMVQKGDTFKKIAKKNKIDMDVLHNANPQIAEPFPGMKVKIPHKRKRVKNHQAKSSPKKVNRETTEHSIGGTRKGPVIEEDDANRDIMQPALPYTMIQEKGKYPLKAEQKYSKQTANTKSSPKRNKAIQTIRYNRIDAIRNQPYNVPEVHVLHGIP